MTRRTAPPLEPTTQRVLSRENAICFPSGDHVGLESSWLPDVSCLVPDPSAAIT